MKRIEPGMLCLVVSGHNAGRECTAVRFCQKYDRVPELGRGAESWEYAWLICGESITAASVYYGEVWRNGYSLCKEHRLMPLSGGDKLEYLETVEDFESVT